MSDRQVVDISGYSLSECTVCNYLAVARGLLAGVDAMVSQRTQMAPPASALMLGHAAELMAKALILHRGLATEVELKHFSNRDRFGHSIANMWREETELFQVAEGYCRSGKAGQLASGGYDFDQSFKALSALHEGPSYASRYGGVNSFPCHEPLSKIFWSVFEAVEAEHNGGREVQ